MDERRETEKGLMDAAARSRARSSVSLLVVLGAIGVMALVGVMAFVTVILAAMHEHRSDGDSQVQFRADTRGRDVRVTRDEARGITTVLLAPGDSFVGVHAQTGNRLPWPVVRTSICVDPTVPRHKYRLYILDTDDHVSNVIDYQER